MSAAQRKRPAAPATIERLVKQLNVTFKAVKLYPLSSAVPRETAHEALEVLRSLLRSHPEVRLEVAKDTLCYEGLPS